MKKMITVLTCLCLFIIFSHAFAQITFKNTIDANKSYETVGIDQSKNGDYLVSMRLDHDTYCARIKNNGEMVWEKVYSTNLPQTTTHLTATSDNGAVIFVQADSTSGIVIKCDSSGNPQWSRRFIMTDTAALKRRPEIYPVAIIEDSKGNYVLLYQLYFWSGGAHEIRVLKFDDSGKLVFRSGVSNIYDVHQAEYLHVRSMAEKSDGNLLIGFGYMPCAFCESGFKPFLITMNNEGKVLSYRQAPLLFSYSDEADALALFSKENKWYILEKYLDHRTGKNFWYFIELNRNDKVLEAEFVPYDLFALQRFIKRKDLEISDFQSFMVNKNRIVNVKYQPKGTRNNESTVITKYDSSSRRCPDFIEPQYSHRITDTGFVFGSEITGAKETTDSLLVEDAGLVAHDTVLMQMNCSGKAADVAIPSEMENNFSEGNAKIYPNPAKDFITLSLQCDKGQQAQIALYNFNNTLVQHFTIRLVPGKNVKRLDISSLPQGVYFIKVSGSEEQNILKFLKE